MSGSSVAGGTAEAQSALWGVRPREWCGMEAQIEPVYTAVLDRLAVRHGTELLDLGRGAGLAAQRGAVVSGFDATPELLAIAAERVPNGDFLRGDLETLRTTTTRSYGPHVIHYYLQFVGNQAQRVAGPEDVRLHFRAGPSSSSMALSYSFSCWARGHS